MRRSFLLLISTSLATTATAQVLATDEIPPPPAGVLPNTGPAVIATSAPTTTTVSATTTNSITTTAVVTTGSPASISYPAGSTLPDGGYICNPAHSYPAGQSCDINAATPTLIYASTGTSFMTTTTSTSYKLIGSSSSMSSPTVIPAIPSPGIYVPPGSGAMSSSIPNVFAPTNSVTWTATWSGQGTTTAATYVGVWTGAADSRAVPVLGALAMGVVGLVV